MIRGRRKLALPEPPWGTGLGGLSPVCPQPTPSSLLQPPSSVLGSTSASDVPYPQDDTLCLRTLLLNWPRCVMGRGLKVHCGGRKPMTLTVALWIPQQGKLTGPQERRQQSGARSSLHTAQTLSSGTGRPWSRSPSSRLTTEGGTQPWAGGKATSHRGRPC